MELTNKIFQNDRKKKKRHDVGVYKICRVLRKKKNK